jgi:reactive intermediate/imine deaminase
VANSFNPPGVAQAVGIYSQASWQPPGRVLHIAGQVAQAEDGSLVGPGDIVRQTRQVFENLRAVLASAGDTMADMQKVTIYVTDLRRLAELRGVLAEFLPQPYPASTLVQVAALVRPEYLIEIETLAVIP